MGEQLTVPFHNASPSPDIPVTSMTSEQLRDYVINRHRERNRIDGEIVQALGQLAALTPPQRPGIELGDGLAEELALDLHLSPNTTAKHLCDAQTLVTRLPGTVAAMVAGDVDVMRAKAMREYTTELDDDQALSVEQKSVV